MLMDRAARQAWALTKDRCQCCGHDFSAWGRWRTVHHICRFRRTEIPTNWLCLCWSPCHQAAELLQIVHDGKRVTKLTLPLCLTLKMRADPSEYDAKVLTRIYGQRLPKPMVITEELEKEWRARR